MGRWAAWCGWESPVGSNLSLPAPSRTQAGVQPTRSAWKPPNEVGRVLTPAIWLRATIARSFQKRPANTSTDSWIAGSWWAGPVANITAISPSDNRGFFNNRSVCEEQGLATTGLRIFERATPEKDDRAGVRGHTRTGARGAAPAGRSGLLSPRVPGNPVDMFGHRSASNVTRRQFLLREACVGNCSVARGRPWDGFLACDTCLTQDAGRTVWPMHM